MPIEPAKPAKAGGTGSGSRNSPRCATKMRSGDSAKTPELPPNAKPGSANGVCQPRTTSYGDGPMGPSATPCARVIGSDRLWCPAFGGAREGG